MCLRGPIPNLAVIMSWLPWMVLVMVLDAPSDPLITAMLLYAVPAVMGLSKVIVITLSTGTFTAPFVGPTDVTVGGVVTVVLVLFGCCFRWFRLFGCLRLLLFLGCVFRWLWGSS